MEITLEIIYLGILAFVAVMFFIIAWMTDKMPTRLAAILIGTGLIAIGVFMVAPDLVPDGETPTAGVSGGEAWLLKGIVNNYTAHIHEDVELERYEVRMDYNTTANTFSTNSEFAEVMLQFSNDGVDDGTRLKAEVIQYGLFTDTTVAANTEYNIIKKVDNKFTVNFTGSGVFFNYDPEGGITFPEATADGVTTDTFLNINITAAQSAVDVMALDDDTQDDTIIRITTVPPAGGSAREIAEITFDWVLYNLDT